MIRSWLVALALALFAAFALPAAAAPKKAPAAEGDGGELKRKAQELLSEGNQLARHGDFGTALVKFRAAYELFQSPKLLLNIGTSLRHSGRYAEAAAVYEQYLDDPQSDPTKRDELSRVVEELEAQLGHLEIQLAEEDLRVSIDGHRLEVFDRKATVRVDPGTHTLTAEKEGRQPTVRHVAVSAQETVPVLLALAEPGEPPPEPVPVRAIVGYSVAGFGGAALIVGAILGGVALSTAADAEDQCPNDGEFAGYCTQEGRDLATSARTQGTAATVTMVLGAAALGAGLAIAWTGDDDEGEAESASVGLRLSGPRPGLQLEARW